MGGKNDIVLPKSCSTRDGPGQGCLKNAWCSEQKSGTLVKDPERPYDTYIINYYHILSIIIIYYCTVIIITISIIISCSSSNNNNSSSIC